MLAERTGDRQWLWLRRWRRRVYIAAAAAPSVFVGGINLGVATNLDSLNVETVVLTGDRVVLSNLDAVDTLIGFNVVGNVPNLQMK